MIGVPLMEKLSTPLLFARLVLSKYTVVQIYHTCICLEQGIILKDLKGDCNPNDKYVYKKELYKACILIPVLSKSVENEEVVGV